MRIGAQVPGRIAEVLVALNDKVAAGDLLVRLDDEELIGRVNSAAAEAAVRKRERDNTEGPPASGPGAPDGRGRRRQRGAAARAEPRGGRSPAQGAPQPAQASGGRHRQGARRRETRPGSGWTRPAPTCARRSPSMACRRRPGPKRRWPRPAPTSPRPTRRSSARASGPPSAGTVLQLNAKAGETRDALARERADRRRQPVLAAGQGGDRGARHRQGARRPGRDHALRRLPRQGLRGQGRLAGAGAGAEPHRPARAAQADRCRRARDA